MKHHPVIGRGYSGARPGDKRGKGRGIAKQKSHSVLTAVHDKQMGGC